MNGKKQAVYDFIRERGDVFSFQLVEYFTLHYCNSANRLARFLVAEGMIMRRDPTEEEKLRYELRARAVVYYIPRGQRYLDFVRKGGY